MKNSRIYIFTIGCIAILAVATFVFSGSERSGKTLKFNHSLHADMSCTDCHDGIETLQAGKRAMPDHTVCAACHEDEVDNNCAMCHLDPENPMAMSGFGEHYLDFSHTAHTKSVKTCAECHGELNAGAEPLIPNMNDCQSCHLSTAKAPLSCGECHQGQSPLPMDHKLTTWHQDHGIESQLAGSDCASCHSQSSCDDCHQGINLTGSPHPPTWKFNHFAEASFGSQCMSCHETRNSCTTCHRVMIPMPHELGPNFANKTTGGTHVQQAEAFMEACLSCHDIENHEPTCAKCHS